MHYDVTPIGYTDFRNQHLRFGIRDQDRLSHIYVIGKTGVGKSTLLLNMAISDIEKGNGVAVIDPHGDLAETILHYIPYERIEDVIYFNVPDTEFPISFNPLSAVSKKQHHVLASGMVSSFKKIWSDSWGPRLEYILRNSFLTLLHYPGATLLDVQPLLTNASFRKEVLTFVDDTYLRSYWYNEFDRYSSAQRNEAIAPILNKVGLFSSSIILRNIVGQSKSGFSIRDVMDEGKILIVNLAKGVIGEDIASILGSLLINSFHLAALTRVEQDISDRKPYYLYIDEVHSFVPLSFANILSETKKFALSLLLTHQYIDQLDEETQSAIFGNVGTVISFRIGAGDAYVLAREFHPVFTMDDFINLPRYSIYLKLMIDGATSKPFSALTMPLQLPSCSCKANIVRLSREKYSQKVEIAAREKPGVEKSSPLQPTLFP